MFSAQRVLYLDSLFCYLIMFSLNHATIFVWIFSRDFPWISSLAHSILLESTPLSRRSASTTSWNVATRPLSSSHCTEDSGIVPLKPWPTAAAQIVTSQLMLFWHDSLLPVSRHLLTIDLTRATHCSVIAPVVNTVIIVTIDLHVAASSGRHTRQRHMPVDRQQRHPARYLRRLFSPDFTERRISTKTPSTITASSTISRRLRVHPAPHHHRLLVSALFTAYRVSSTSYASLHQPR